MVAAEGLCGHAERGRGCGMGSGRQLPLLVGPLGL